MDYRFSPPRDSIEIALIASKVQEIPRQNRERGRIASPKGCIDAAAHAFLLDRM
jgi:hypothetical protein